MVLTDSIPPSKWQGQKLGGHAAGGCFFFLFEEFDYLLTVLRLHLHQNLLGAFLGQFAEQVGGRVRAHLLNDLGGALGIERLDNRFLHPGRNFFERFGGGRLVERLKDCLPLIGR